MPHKPLHQPKRTDASERLKKTQAKILSQKPQPPKRDAAEIILAEITFLDNQYKYWVNNITQTKLAISMAHDAIKIVLPLTVKIAEAANGSPLTPMVWAPAGVLKPNVDACSAPAIARIPKAKMKRVLCMHPIRQSHRSVPKV